MFKEISVLTLLVAMSTACFGKPPTFKIYEGNDSELSSFGLMPQDFSDMSNDDELIALVEADESSNDVIMEDDFSKSNEETLKEDVFVYIPFPMTKVIDEVNLGDVTESSNSDSLEDIDDSGSGDNFFTEGNIVPINESTSLDLLTPVTFPSVVFDQGSVGIRKKVVRKIGQDLRNARQEARRIRIFKRPNVKRVLFSGE